MTFYGQFNPPVDKFLYERYFLNKKNGIAIECGAFDGQIESSCKFFEETMGWKVINIEASPPNYKKLIINRPNSINLDVALSDSIGITKFTHVISPECGENFGNGSILHSDVHKKQLINDGCKFVNYEVKTTTYTEMIKTVGLTELDLMVLDVEGYEGTVIKGMIGCPVLPKILCIEHGHLGIEKTKELVSKLPYIYDTSLVINSYYKRI
jgi:FkbM family methyltransferase